MSLLAGMLSVAAVSGCESGTTENRIELSGAVTLDGTALDVGSLTFFPAEGLTAPTANAGVMKGQYAFTRENGPIPGQYRVEVRRAPGKNATATQDELPKYKWEFEVTVPEQGPATQNFQLE
jgi:hypothetical protein